MLRCAVRHCESWSRLRVSYVRYRVVRSVRPMLKPQDSIAHWEAPFFFSYFPLDFRFSLSLPTSITMVAGRIASSAIRARDAVLLSTCAMSLAKT